MSVMGFGFPVLPSGSGGEDGLAGPIGVKAPGCRGNSCEPCAWVRAMFQRLRVRHPPMMKDNCRSPFDFAQGRLSSLRSSG